jgi:tRNA threonylcarbamoyl adenosine modification protein YeaZ
VSTVLVIDSASTRFALALAVDGELLDAVWCEEPRAHTRLLVPWVDRLLGDRQGALSGIVAVTGPGSYAGLRAGLATASSLALAMGVPLAGVTVFEALAHCDTPSGHWVAVQPVGRGQFAALDFDGATPIGEPRVVPLDALPSVLRGEGAEARGGVEMTPLDRVQGALRAGLLALRAPGGAGGLSAYYLTEPNITRATRTPLVAPPPGA